MSNFFFFDRFKNKEPFLMIILRTKRFSQFYLHKPFFCLAHLSAKIYITFIHDMMGLCIPPRPSICLIAVKKDEAI